MGLYSQFLESRILLMVTYLSEKCTDILWSDPGIQPKTGATATHYQLRSCVRKEELRCIKHLPESDFSDLATLFYLLNFLKAVLREKIP